MLKSLKKKFVLTAMFSLTILLAILILAVSVLSYVNADNTINTALEKIINSNYDDFPGSDKDKRTVFGYSIGLTPNFQKDSFIVYVTQNQITVDTSRHSSVNLSDDEIKSYVKTVLESDSPNGKVSSYKYLKRNFGQNGTKIAFVDTSTQMHMIANIIKTSCTASIVLLAIMFLIVYLISSKAVKPIAQNIEKQKRFITDAGHEIKTPLAIISANIDAWELKPDEHKYVKNIKEQTSKLTLLTNRLLVLAKSDEDSHQPEKTNICLSEIVFNSLDSFTHLLNGRNFVEDIFDDVNINANPYQTKEIITILLDNAIKYSTKNSDIAVKLWQKQGFAYLSIENETEVLPDVAPQTLFERFYRFDNSRNSATGGNGIGLSIAHDFAKANSGTLTASYAPANKIIFTLSFKSLKAK